MRPGIIGGLASGGEYPSRGEAPSEPRPILPYLYYLALPTHTPCTAPDLKSWTPAFPRPSIATPRTGTRRRTHTALSTQRCACAPLAAPALPCLASHRDHRPKRDVPPWPRTAGALRTSAGRTQRAHRPGIRCLHHTGCLLPDLPTACATAANFSPPTSHTYIPTHLSSAARTCGQPRALQPAAIPTRAAAAAAAATTTTTIAAVAHPRLPPPSLFAGSVDGPIAAPQHPSQALTHHSVRPRPSIVFVSHRTIHAGPPSTIRASGHQVRRLHLDFYPYPSPIAAAGPPARRPTRSQD